MTGIFRLAIISLFAAAASAAETVRFHWPTPNRAYLEGGPLADFIQPSSSGRVESGMFGCGRSGGAQFHEGLDLAPVTRSSVRLPKDPVMAALPGIVRHISTHAGNSSYGRYIVLEHPALDPMPVTLYAHLAAIAPGLKVGDRVLGGQVIGRMGNSAGGYTIPRSRAHLHFEIGFWVTDKFQDWYNSRRFGSPNMHGYWNGMNILGVDPLPLFARWQENPINGWTGAFQNRELAVRVRVVSRRVPDFVERYGGFLRTDGKVFLPGGWDIDIDPMGLPFAWRPVKPEDVAGQAQGSTEILEVTPANSTSCRDLIAGRQGDYRPGKQLQTLIDQVFGPF